MSIIRTPLRDAMERSRRFLGESSRESSTPEGKSTLLNHLSIREHARAEARFAARHELPANAPSPLERYEAGTFNAEKSDLFRSAHV